MSSTSLGVEAFSTPVDSDSQWYHGHIRIPIGADHFGFIAPSGDAAALVFTANVFMHLNDQTPAIAGAVMGEACTYQLDWSDRKAKWKAVNAMPQPGRTRVFAAASSWQDAPSTAASSWQDAPSTAASTWQDAAPSWQEPPSSWQDAPWHKSGGPPPKQSTGARVPKQPSGPPPSDRARSRSATRPVRAGTAAPVTPPGASSLLTGRACPVCKQMTYKTGLVCLNTCCKLTDCERLFKSEPFVLTAKQQVLSEIDEA